MSENELLALLRLHGIPGIGPIGVRKLVGYFGSAEAIFNETIKSLMRIPGIGRARACMILEEEHKHTAEQEWDRLRESDIQCIPFWDAAYPQLLSQCEDAPSLLFQKGRISLNDKRLVSIVGTRNMTDYGRRNCERLVEELVPFRPVIVSGLAFGIDICAQRAALRCGLPTVACLGHGLDQVYPNQHRRFAKEIVSQGGLLSEFFLGTPPERMHFVRRNRIIAGLSEATIIVESASQGGSLITADLAFGYHREVFAVPGRTTDFYSAGCNALIRNQKAHLFQSVDELAEVMNWAGTNETSIEAGRFLPNYEELGPEERSITDFLLQKQNANLDDIAVGCGCAVKKVATLLFGLEMKGIIRPLPGKRYSLAPG